MQAIGAAALRIAPCRGAGEAMTARRVRSASAAVALRVTDLGVGLSRSLADGHTGAGAALCEEKRARAERSLTMPGMSALGFPDLLLACPRVERVVAKLALEHG
jgi:hypothetical protein